MGERSRSASSIVRSSLLLAAALPALLLGCAQAERYHKPIRVAAAVETAPVPSTEDAADDPAIWIDAEDPSKSLVIGTDKGSGLLVYDLAGRQIQYLSAGEFNNVDIRREPWDRAGVSLLAATQRNPSRLVLFALDHDSRKVRIESHHTTQLEEPYGICLYQDASAQPFVIANSKDGEFIQYRVGEDYSLRAVRSWRTESQPEGCVADDDQQVLYVGEEAVGIWALPADPEEPPRLESFDTVDNGYLVADVEGLALYHGADRTYLVASSQGDDSYVVYDTTSRRYEFSFQVGPGSTIDGASETDGLAIVANELPGFPAGLLVVQDGLNLMPRANQNFKYVSWADVESAARR